jgi:two-component system sensor histidine kinase VanS
LKSKLEVDEAMKKLADGGIASYGLVFADDKTDYLLTCYDYGYHENLIPRGLAQSYPLMIAVVVSISLVSSIVYTLLFALPVKKLSRVSRRMAQMDFTARCDSRRGDEIGDLARDLNLMSSTLDNKIRELEEEIRRVRELESQKEMFFAAASHELKTPVTVLEGHIRGMIEGVGPYEDHDEYLARSLRTVKRMESLINEILTASKMQSFDDVERTRIDMAKILKSKLSESEDLFAVRNIKVVEDTEDELYFSGNAELTSLALGAFISNAVFYSGEGSRIDITARNDSGRIMLYIKNMDAHIDEKDLPHLFEAFYRSDSSRNRRDGGSGLGLYIARLIITKQGGECSLYNDGDGVTAEIIFPST